MRYFETLSRHPDKEATVPVFVFFCPHFLSKKHMASALF